MAVGSELLILAIPLGIALIVLFVVLSARGSLKQTGSHTARVHGDTDSVLQDIQLALSGLKNTSVHREHGNVVALERSMTPTWAIVVAVLFFPIGLVALAARTAETGTIAADGSGDGVTTLRMAGTFNRPATAAINDVISTRSQA